MNTPKTIEQSETAVASSDLLACPFCGGKVTIEKCKCWPCKIFHQYWKLECECGAASAFNGYDPLEMIKDWNTRKQANAAHKPSGDNQ